MDIVLRAERPQDYRETEDVTREAFWNNYAPGANEHYLLHTMRDDPAFLPELDIVALHEGKIVGNVVCVKAAVEGDDGKGYEALTLGPIAVLPEYQGQGIGGMLMEHVKGIARDHGYRAIFLLGDPEYYSRFGFVPSERYGIRMADDTYMAAHQVFELFEGALEGMWGRYFEGSVYEVDDAAAAEFDKGFPSKEKVAGTPAQKRFEELAAMKKSAF